MATSVPDLAGQLIRGTQGAEVAHPFWGKLTWDIFPFYDPILLGTFIVVCIGGGALVAALAAYKDLSSPWKELLNYYNRVQDLSLRWHLIIDRFDPQGMVDEQLFDEGPEEIPHLDGDIELQNVTVVDHNGDAVLEDITQHVPKGTLVAVSAA